MTTGVPRICSHQ